MRTACGAIALLCAALLPLPAHADSGGTAPTLTTTPTPTSRTASPAAVSALLQAINADRQRHHRPLLTLDPLQSRCSRAHSRHMAQLGRIAHDQFPQDICTSTVWMGENVGQASGYSLRAALLWLHSMMMAEGPCPHHSCPGSELEKHGHYLNLMDPHFTRVGIGVYIAGRNVWLTEDFVSGPPDGR